MLPVRGDVDQPLHFCFAQYDGKFFDVPDLGKFDVAVRQTFHPIDKPQSVNGHFEIGHRRRRVALCQMIKVFFGFPIRQFCREAVKGVGDFGQMQSVTADHAFAFAENDRAPFKSLEEFEKAGHIVAGLFYDCPFFFIGTKFKIKCPEYTIRV